MDYHKAHKKEIIFNTKMKLKVYKRLVELKKSTLVVKLHHWCLKN